MKIALVILHADPARGGAERYTFDLAAALAGRGHDVSLPATSFAGAPQGVRQVPIRAPGVTRLGRYRNFLNALDRHLDEQPYDVVHAMLPVRRCDVYHPHAGLAAEGVRSGHLKHAGRLARASARVANRLNVKRRAFAAVERKLLTGPRPPTVLCLSEYVKQTVRRHYPSLPEGRLATLFNAIDLDKFDPSARPDAGAEVRRRLGIADDGVVGLMIAQDFERKGLAEAIRASAGLGSADARGGFRLVVVGRESPGRYQALAGSEASPVHFAGPTDDPYAFYKAADFFVLPTRHDPCSLVVLEALAMGVPVISTVYNGACEVMADGVHGFVLSDPSDVHALSDAMRQMLSGDRRREMSGACLDLRPRLAYGKHLDDLLAIYRTVKP